MLTAEQQQTLLRVAREAVVAATEGRSYAPSSGDPELRKPGAAFVTLRRDDELRGCIGRVEARDPLLEVVAEMARAAALEDFRFQPVEASEVADLTIEISVLTPAVRVTDVAEIEVGTHGLIVSKGDHRGLLLPQVPVEWGWDREEFLDHTCLKAGLPKGCWRGEAEICAFTAQVFGEEG